MKKFFSHSAIFVAFLLAPMAVFAKQANTKFHHHKRSDSDKDGTLNPLLTFQKEVRKPINVYDALPSLSQDAPDDAGDLILCQRYMGIRTGKDGNSIINHHTRMKRKAPLSKAFKGIETWQDLVKRYKNNLPLILIDDNGNELLTVDKWKIVEFSNTFSVGEQ